MTTGSSGRPSDTVLVTGSSAGLGLVTALYLAARGFKVYASMRDLDKQGPLVEAAESRGVRVELLQLDLTDADSIERAVETVVRESGGIYGLVNNGGIGLRGCLEDLQDDEIRQVFEANVFGTINLTQAVLPHMREAGRGRILTISSVGGRISSFGVSIYCASKFALEGFGEALALEVAPFGIQAVLIEPGIINTTRWTTRRGTARNALNPDSPYYELFKAGEAMADQIVDRSKTRPADVAKTVYEALTVENPRMRYIVGKPAAAAVVARRYLPERLFERVYFGSFLRQLTSEARAAEHRASGAASQQ